MFNTTSNKSIFKLTIGLVFHLPKCRELQWTLWVVLVTKMCHEIFPVIKKEEIEYFGNFFRKDMGKPVAHSNDLENEGGKSKKCSSQGILMAQKNSTFDKFKYNPSTKNS